MKRKVLAAVGALAWMWEPQAAYATTTPSGTTTFDETITVEREEVVGQDAGTIPVSLFQPGGSLCPETLLDCVIVGDSELSLGAVSIQVFEVVAGSAVVTTGNECRWVDKRIALDLEAGATDQVSASFVRVGHGGTVVTKSIDLPDVALGTTLSLVIHVCVD